MQKWSPDEFTDQGPAAKVSEPDWKQLSLADSLIQSGGTPATRFQKESRFADPKSLLSNLTQEERALLFELVEQDVAREYEVREVELKAEQEKQLSEIRSEFDKHLESWSTNFGASHKNHYEDELREIAQASAQLAIQLAGKITRCLVPLDSEILVRGIHTALFKVTGNQPIDLVTHPDDAVWLRERPDLLAKMNIREIGEDRRVERGGCLIQSGGQEWNVTLDGQMEALGEVVQESIATAGTDEKPTRPEDENEPGLD